MAQAGRLLDAALPDSLNETARQAVIVARQQAWAFGFRLAMSANLLAAMIAAAAGWKIPRELPQD